MKQIITDQNFQEFLKNEKPIILDFSASWCGPCKKVGEIIEDLAPNYEASLIIGLCDIDENFELTKQYGIRNVPTILFIKNGEIVDKQIGAASKEVFQEKFNNLLK